MFWFHVKQFITLRYGKEGYSAKIEEINTKPATAVVFKLPVFNARVYLVVDHGTLIRIINNNEIYQQYNEPIND